MSPDDGKDGPVMSQALSSGVFGRGGLRDGYLRGGVLLGCPCIMEGLGRPWKSRCGDGGTPKLFCLCLGAGLVATRHGLKQGEGP